MFIKLTKHFWIKLLRDTRDFFVTNPLLVPIIILCLGTFLWQRGYFLSLDWLYGPEIKLVPTQYYPNQIPWIYLQKIFSLIIPAWILQKVVIISFFVIAYLSIKRFVYSFTTDRVINELVALFYIFNPFFYSRVIQGQWAIVLAYGLLPLIFASLFSYIKEATWKKAWSIGLISAVIISLSSHYIFFLIAVAVIFLVFYFPKIKWKHLFIFIGVPLILNSYWLFNINQTTNLSRFSQLDQLAFANTKLATNSYYLDLLSLHGFWGEKYSRFQSIYQINHYWWVIFIFIFIFVLGGAFLSFKKKSRAGYAMLALCIVSFILASGAQGTIFSGFNNWLYDHIPGYIGLREANKWLTILVIGYAYFIIEFFKFLFNKKLVIDNKKVITFIIGIIIVGYGAGLLFGFNGQLYASDYPVSWYKLKNKFSDDKTNRYYSILALPWHQSMSFNFSKKIIMNPVGLFFDGHNSHVLFGDNLEIGLIYSQSTRAESKVVERYVRQSPPYSNEVKTSFINDLKKIGINYIVLFKEVDWVKYKLWFENNNSSVIEEDNQDFLYIRLK